VSSNSQFEVSVIIPVYNAEPFLRKAVESAEQQEVVKEIILVEDKSPDHSWDLCLKLDQEYKKVKAFRHPDLQNHGCGATRNYGLTLASCDFVTFADADNYILPNRYQKDIEVLQLHPDASGIYNCMGVHYYTDSSKKIFLNTVNEETLTFSEPVPPEEVPLVFLSAHPDNVTGSWGIDGLTIRKDLFEKSGVFNTKLKLQQDMDLYMKMSMVGKFYPGEIEKPTCVRGVHDQQRSTNSSQMDYYRIQRWKSVKNWIKANPHVEQKLKDIFKRRYNSLLIQKSPRAKALFYLIRFAWNFPNEFRNSYGDFDFNFWKVFGKNWLTLRIISFKNKALTPKR